MQGDKIGYNSLITTFEESDIEWGLLLRNSYVYQNIHTQQGEPLMVEEHLEILTRNFKSVYGTDLQLEAESIRQQIRTLLRNNHYPAHGACHTTLLATPHPLSEHSFGPDYVIQVNEQLLYPHYTLWHTQPCLALTQVDLPFPGIATSASLAIGLLGREIAFHQAAQLTVIQTRTGMLTNVLDEPLFIYIQKTLLTTPLEEGATDTIMRRLVIRAAKKMGIPVRESPIHYTLMAEAEEVFVGSVQGLISFGSIGQITHVDGSVETDTAGKLRYFNTVAKRLVDQIQAGVQL